MKRPKNPPRIPPKTTNKNLVWAEIHSGIGSGKEWNRKVQKHFNIPFAFLTEEQWLDIRSKAGLRDNARFELNIALRRYWSGIIDTTVSPETLSAVVKQREQLQAAIEGLVELMTSEEFYKGPVACHEPSRLHERLEIEAACDAMHRAQLILSSAEKRLRTTGAPQYQHLYDLIHHLDFIFYKTHGICLSRSNNRIPFGGATHSPKQFVQAVVEVGNLKVPWSTVDTVLKHYIKDRGSDGYRSFPKRAL